MSAQRNGRSGAPRGPQEDAPDFTLILRCAGYVLRAPARHPALSAGAFLAVVGVAAALLQALPARYQVQASVLAQGSPLMGALSNPTLNRQWDTPTQAARELVLRRDNLVALCRETHFVERYLATRAPAVRARDRVLELLREQQRTPEELEEDLVDTLEQRLWVVVGAEGIVTITFEWSDRALAYDLVQAALDSFLEARQAAEVSLVSEMVAILEGHVTRVRKEIDGVLPRVEAREREVRADVRARDRVPARPRPAVDEELGRLESVLTARRRALSELDGLRRRRLQELQDQLAQAQSQYAPDHPAFVALRQTIDSLSAPSPQLEALRNDVRDTEREIVRRGGVPSLGDEQAPADAGGGVELALRLPGADPRVEYERGQLRLLFRQYSSLLDRLDAARVELDTARAAFKHRYQVVTPPRWPKRPIRRSPGLVMLGAVLGGFAFALFSAAATDVWSGRAVEAWQLERRFGVPVVAEIPE